MTVDRALAKFATITEELYTAQQLIDAGKTLATEVRRLRQLHAEAVEAAFYEGWNSYLDPAETKLVDAWIASEAKKGLEP